MDLENPKPLLQGHVTDLNISVGGAVVQLVAQGLTSLGSCASG